MVTVLQCLLGLWCSNSTNSSSSCCCCSSCCILQRVVVRQRFLVVTVLQCLPPLSVVVVSSTVATTRIGHPAAAAVVLAVWVCVTRLLCLPVLLYGPRLPYLHRDVSTVHVWCSLGLGLELFWNLISKALVLKVWVLNQSLVVLFCIVIFVNEN